MSGHHAPIDQDEPDIHLPSPSFSPVLIGIGVTFICFGILFGIPLVIIGGLTFVVGLATWLIDDARTYAQAGDHDGHGGGH